MKDGGLSRISKIKAVEIYAKAVDSGKSKLFEVESI